MKTATTRERENIFDDFSARQLYLLEGYFQVSAKKDDQYTSSISCGHIV